MARDILFNSPDYRLLIVSPDGTIWEITVNNEGVLVVTDTGEIYSP